MLGTKDSFLADFLAEDSNMVQGLTGPIPDVCGAVSAKISQLRLASTGLQQCSASHVTALANNPGATLVHAGSSDNMAADNVTGCLPDLLQFCETEWAGPNTNMMCPSVAFRRPTIVLNNLAKVSALQHVQWVLM